MAEHYGKIIARVRAREEARRERVYQESREAFSLLSMMEYRIKKSSLRGDLVTFPGSYVIDRPIVEPPGFLGRFW